MMTIVHFYWPVLVVSLLNGVISGVLAFRPRALNTWSRDEHAD